MEASDQQTAREDEEVKQQFPIRCNEQEASDQQTAGKDEEGKQQFPNSRKEQENSSKPVQPGNRSPSGPAPLKEDIPPVFPFVELPYDVRRMVYLLFVNEKQKSIPLRGSDQTYSTYYQPPSMRKEQIFSRPIEALLLVNRQISSEAQEVYYGQKVFTAKLTCYDSVADMMVISSTEQTY
ncbi:hypothetical protein MMC30_008914 [Trapelia coarctata]|nr:hypothetical protein [Trapelia coarctata]